MRRFIRSFSHHWSAQVGHPFRCPSWKVAYCYWIFLSLCSLLDELPGSYASATFSTCSTCTEGCLRGMKTSHLQVQPANLTRACFLLQPSFSGSSSSSFSTRSPAAPGLPSLESLSRLACKREPANRSFLAVIGLLSRPLGPRGNLCCPCTVARTARPMASSSSSSVRIVQDGVNSFVQWDGAAAGSDPRTRRRGSIRPQPVTPPPSFMSPREFLLTFVGLATAHVQLVQMVDARCARNEGIDEAMLIRGTTWKRNRWKGIAKPRRRSAELDRCIEVLRFSRILLRSYPFPCF